MTRPPAASISRRYGLILGATFVVVLLLSAGLVGVTYTREETAERDRIALRLSERLVELNAVVRGTIDAVDALRARAESLTAPAEGTAPPPTRLAPAPSGLLTLDQPPPGVDRRGHGNVIVTAALPEPALSSELRIALGLGPTFVANTQAAPFLAWQHFVSADGTVAVFPWISSRLFPLAPDPRTRTLFVAGTSRRNPGRHRFWIGPEDDAAGKGPIVGGGAPVYERDRFAGTVAVLVQLEALGEITERLRYPLGRLLLLDESNRVLAASGAGLDVGRAPGSLHDLAPEAGVPGIARAIAAPAGRWQTVDGRLIFAAELDQAPWRLVYLVKRFDLARGIAARSGAAVVGPLLGLALLLVVAYVATRREFVRPATHLVAHIDAASRRADATIPPVPADWRPFFTAVSDSFAAHGQLVAIRQELEVARRMQEAILPSAFPPHPLVELSASMTPALEVGGDFYDYFWLDATRLGLVIADVSDKGIGAALFMAVSRTLLRAVAPTAPGPAAALRTASALLAEDNTTNMFVTIFYGVLDVETGDLIYANGGHNVPLVISSGAVEPLPKIRGAALGMFPDQRFDEGRTTLPAGAALFLYTDGVVEATSADKTEFGVARLSATLATQAAASPETMLAATLNAVDDFASGTPKPDDITCLVVRRLSS